MQTLPSFLDNEAFINVYKDTYGVKPRDHEYFTASDERKEELTTALFAEFDRVQNEENAREYQARVDFDKLVDANLELGAENREQAIIWAMNSVSENETDGGYYCYLFGLDYEFTDMFNHCIMIRDAL